MGISVLATSSQGKRSVQKAQLKVELQGAFLRDRQGKREIWSHEICPRSLVHGVHSPMKSLAVLWLVLFSLFLVLLHFFVLILIVR